MHIIRFKPLVEYDLNPNLNYHLIKFKHYKILPDTQFRYKFFARAVDKYILAKIGQPDIVLSNLFHVDRVMAHSKLPNLMYVIRNTATHDFNLINDPDAHSTIEKLQQVYGKHPCVCVSKGVETDLKAVLGDNIASKTIYNAFDKPAIEQWANEPFSSLHKVLKPQQYLLHVGSFKYQKAHDILLNAYAKSSKNYPLVLLGKGKLFADTKALAENLVIADKVVFLGFDKNPYPYIRHARGLVLSSRFEGFVRVIPEALALNIPVVSTNCESGPSEMLPASSLVPVDDIDALAAKMTALMEDPLMFAVSFDEQFLPKSIAQQYVDYLTS